MTKRYEYDAIVVGAGPNGLAAAITLARAGRSVIVYEAKETIGGGARTMELTLPGFQHDICSAFHPLGLGSPFFRTLPLAQFGVEWIHPTVPLAHPLDDGTAAVLDRSIEATCASLGVDANAYRKLMQPSLDKSDSIVDAFLGPLRPQSLRHPFVMARFGLKSLPSARLLAELRFKGEHARALFAGMAAHSMLPLERPVSAGFGLFLGLLGHAIGWPIPRGGSQKIVDAMAAYLRTLGGEIVTGVEVKSMDSLPLARAVLFDVTPRQLLRIAGSRLPGGYQRQLHHYRYGPGVFKIDYALHGPVPWKAEACRGAGTVHLGGTLPEIAAAEGAVWKGEPPEKPFVLVGQQSLFDPTRTPQGPLSSADPKGSCGSSVAELDKKLPLSSADPKGSCGSSVAELDKKLPLSSADPKGSCGSSVAELDKKLKQTLWVYCHVPGGSTFDMTERIEAQIERFAPGFRDFILARHVTDAEAIEQYNPNYIGGDINGGVQDLWQFFTRPTIRPVPYATPARDIFICSSSTPPGGGVHGMCGYYAAKAALGRVLS